MFRFSINRLDVVAFVTRCNPSTHPVMSLYFNRLKYGGRINSTKPSDIKVLVCDDPIAVLLGKIFFPEAKIIFFVLEMFEFQRGDGVSNGIKNLIYRMFNRAAHRVCNTLIYPNQLRRRWYGRKKWNSNKTNVFVFQNVSSEQDSTYDAFDDYAYKGSFPEIRSDKVSLIYAGSLHNDRGVKLISLISEFDGVDIYICSSDRPPPALIRSNIIFLGYYKRSKLLALYKHFDGAIVSYDNSPRNARYAAPVKIWEYVEANLLVIANCNYSLRREYRNLIDFFVTDKGLAAAYFQNVIDLKRVKALRCNSGKELVSSLRFNNLLEFDRIVESLT
jgi:hypothetical protein